MDVDYKKMIICAAVMITAIAVPYFFVTIPALIFISVMYSDNLTKNAVQVIDAINEKEIK